MGYYLGYYMGYYMGYGGLESTRGHRRINVRLARRINERVACGRGAYRQLASGGVMLRSL